MAWTIHLDQSSQACLDRLTSAISLHTTSIARLDKTMSALTDAADALKVEVASAVAAIKDEATQITNLVAQLAAANAANNSAEVDAVTAQLQQAASDLHAAIDATHAPTPAA